MQRLVEDTLVTERSLSAAFLYKSQSLVELCNMIRQLIRFLDSRFAQNDPKIAKNRL